MKRPILFGFDSNIVMSGVRFLALRISAFAVLGLFPFSSTMGGNPAPIVDLQESSVLSFSYERYYTNGLLKRVKHFAPKDVDQIALVENLIKVLPDTPFSFSPSHVGEKAFLIVGFKNNHCLVLERVGGMWFSRHDGTVVAAKGHVLDERDRALYEQMALAVEAFEKFDAAIWGDKDED